jgi:hypothetical protein
MKTYLKKAGRWFLNVRGKHWSLIAFRCGLMAILITLAWIGMCGWYDCLQHWLAEGYSPCIG